MEPLYFISTNSFKAEEVTNFFKSSILKNNIELKVISDISINEIMDLELEPIVKDKLLKAYKNLGQPCVVEHGALHIEYLKRLPGGLSKVVWDTLGEQICELLPCDINKRKATAKSVVAYCDGMNVHLFTGETEGYIAEKAKEGRAFQWDPIFIPNGETKTYSEFGINEKMTHSQAIKAWKKLIDFLNDK